MSEPNKYREWILETIDSLRSRKARPDLERICRMVRRRHGSDPDRTRTELEKLIQEQTVLKVSYKGSISYRNAAKVQRKSRKKSELTAAGRERSGDSFTDQEEGEEDSEPSPGPGPLPPTPAAREAQKPESATSPRSGNGCLGCGATTGCAVGSGCKEEKASAPRDEGLGGRRGPGGCPGVTGLTDSDAGLGDRDDTQNTTCSGSVANPQQRQKQTAPLKPKLRVAKPAGGHANSDLGDRLAASVRSLSERRGPAKPLGLKEMVGCLSSQEKLTRGQVNVVLEREVARGRLRRTRCGNITVPPRGVEEVENDRLAKSALQDDTGNQVGSGDLPPCPSLRENAPMETASEEEERGEKEEEEEQKEEEEEEEEDPRSSDEEAGGLPPVAMATEPELIEKTTEDAETRASEQESPPPQHAGTGLAAGLTGMCGLDSLTRTPQLPAQGASLSQCHSEHSEDRAVVSDQLHMEAQSQMQEDRLHHTSSDFNNLESKTEVGVSSCLLTPTASPRDSGMSEDRGMNGGGGFIKSEGASGGPVDWTVSDVVSYFTEAGFPEQAAAFGTQEIDGKSLLLMQRNDVLTGLSIKLGPALKIYERHVKVLQKTHFEDDDC